MKSVKELLKEKTTLSNYQIAQLTFLWKTFASEISKVLILGILFYKKLPIYCFALVVMVILRCSTGGIHFDSYIGCFLMSFLYLWLGIRVLSYLPLSLGWKMPLLLACAFLCYSIGPVPSKYRPTFSKQFILRCKIIITVFILIYTSLLYIIPESPYMTVGFWIIILHSLQLSVAKYIRKEKT